MPSSRPNTIPTVIHLIRQLRPKSILDVGVGFGKWGHLFREYTDIQAAEHDPARYERKNWRVRIDGIEGHAAYVTKMHRYLYNKIYIGDATALIRKIPRHDVVFLGDVIEHLEKGDGVRLLHDALEAAEKAVIVSTPKYETEQADLCGNELERHRSLWTARDFRRLGRAIVKTVDQSILLAVLVKAGVPTPVCRPPRQLKPDDARRLRLAKEALARIVDPAEIFILVDEEQIRSELPHRRAFPFLEKAGEFWGPPSDDGIAIREFERLRKSGARFIAFIWTTYWWLDHFAGFQRHLRSNFRCVRDDDCLVVFDLCDRGGRTVRARTHGTNAPR
jgi:hypothetical protein